MHGETRHGVNSPLQFSPGAYGEQQPTSPVDGGFASEPRRTREMETVVSRAAENKARDRVSWSPCVPPHLACQASHRRPAGVPRRTGSTG